MRYQDNLTTVTLLRNVTTNFEYTYDRKYDNLH